MKYISSVDGTLPPFPSEVVKVIVYSFGSESLQFIEVLEGHFSSFLDLFFDPENWGSNHGKGEVYQG